MVSEVGVQIRQCRHRQIQAVLIGPQIDPIVREVQFHRNLSRGRLPARPTAISQPVQIRVGHARLQHSHYIYKCKKIITLDRFLHSVDHRSPAAVRDIIYAGSVCGLLHRHLVLREEDVVVVLYFYIGDVGHVIIKANRDCLLCELRPEERDVPVLVTDCPISVGFLVLRNERIFMRITYRVRIVRLLFFRNVCIRCCSACASIESE